MKKTCLSFIATMTNLIAMEPLEPTNEKNILDIAQIAQASYKVTNEIERQNMAETLFASGYTKILEKEDHSTFFCAQAWEKEEKIVISYRGTVPSSPNNLLSDIGITTFAGLDHSTQEDSLKYLTNHLQKTYNDYLQENEIPYEETHFTNLIDMVHQNPLGFRQNISTFTNFTVCAPTLYLLSAGLVNPFAGAIILGSTFYASQSLSRGDIFTNTGETKLISSCQSALSFLQDVRALKGNTMKITLTGHSLGGFMANVVGALNPTIDTISFNAPGGVTSFLNKHMNTLLCTDNGWSAYLRSLNPYATKDTLSFINTGNKIINYIRRNDIVGNIGDPIGQIIFMENFNKTNNYVAPEIVESVQTCEEETTSSKFAEYFKNILNTNTTALNTQKLISDLAQYAQFTLDNHSIKYFIEDFKSTNL